MRPAALWLLTGLLSMPAMAQEAAVPASPVPANATMQSDGKTYQAVELRALNKVTARSELLRVPLGDSVTFGNITLTPRNCYVSSSDKLPEQAVFLEISEMHSDASPERLFTGWMFSSSPALSALEHPVYDVTMVACKETLAEPKTPAAPVPKK